MHRSEDIETVKNPSSIGRLLVALFFVGVAAIGCTPAAPSHTISPPATTGNIDKPNSPVYPSTLSADAGGADASN
jgi:hypothetical protein